MNDTQSASTSGAADVMNQAGGISPLAMANALAAAQQQRQEDIDTSTWFSVYPCYINKSTSVTGGRYGVSSAPLRLCAPGRPCSPRLRPLHPDRKVPRSIAVEDPLAPHIAEICANQLKLPTALHRKRHPRDARELGVGRVKVKLFKDDGASVNPDVKTRKQLYRRCAELMHKHPATFAAGKPTPAGVGGIGGKALPQRKGK